MRFLTHFCLCAGASWLRSYHIKGVVVVVVVVVVGPRRQAGDIDEAATHVGLVIAALTMQVAAALEPQMLSQNLIFPEPACNNPPVVGLRFHMRLADARHLWPGWQGNTRQGKRVCWMVSEGSPVHGQLLCKYVGRNHHNQGLIGNRGVRRFARSHVLKSGETIGKLLAAGHLNVAGRVPRPCAET